MMSSTSSNECDCENYWPNLKNGYLTSYADVYGSNHPFYPTMGHPLVYYSQAPQSRKFTHQDRKRGSPNCFVKAFRWYTKDVPFRKASPPNRDISSFAAWLDVKYDQFLEDSQMGSDKYHIRLSQTFEAERAFDQNNNNNCEPCSTKMFRKKRLSKKRGHTKSNDVRLERQKSNHSCKYIMQPKGNLSRSASVCCHPLNSTTAVSESENKTMRKSQSVSNATVIKNKEPDDPKPGQGDIGDKSCHDTTCCASNRQTDTAEKAPYDQPQTNICKKAGQKESCYTNKENMCPNKTGSKLSLTEKDKIWTVNNTELSQDFGCQYYQENKTKVNEETQYDVVVPPTSQHYGSVPSYQSERSNQCECPEYDKQIQRPTSRVVQNTYITPCRSGTAECHCKSVDAMTEKHVKVKKNHKKLSETHRIVECQCPGKVVAVNVESQYSPPPHHQATGSRNNNTCECNFKKSVRHYEASKQSIPISTRQCCSCEPKIIEKPVAEKRTSGCVMYAQTTSQTSSHSIHLEQDAVPEYPLFLRIVRADNLSGENVK